MTSSETEVRAFPAARSAAAPALVFLVAAAFFAAGLAARDLWTTAEHRYAEVARELVAPGHDALVPHLNGAVYPEKPPGWFWVAGALHRFLALDLAVAARIPSIVGGALAVLVTFLLARRWWGRNAGLVAAGTVATAHLFDSTSRSGQLDAWLSAFVVLTIHAFVRAEEAATRRARAGWTAIGWLAVGAGILVKGPAAIVIPAAVFVPYLAAVRPRRLLTWTPIWSAALAAVPGLVWLVAARAHAGDSYVRILLKGHAIGHATGHVDKLEPWHYYLWAVPASLVPWSAFLPAGLRALRRSGRPAERSVDVLLVSWLVAPVVVLSLFPAKRDLYLLAVHPAAALLVARLFRDAAEDDRRLRDPWLAWPLRCVAGGAAVAGTVLAAVAIAGLLRGPAGVGIDAIQAEYFGASYAASRLVLAALFAAAACAAGIAAWRARTSWRAAAALVGAAASAHLVNALVVASARDAEQSPRAFLEEVRTTIGDAPLARLGDDGGLQYAVNWILERDTVPELRSAAAAQSFLGEGGGARFVVTDADELRQFGRPAGAVTLLRRTRRRCPELVLLGNAATSGH